MALCFGTNFGPHTKARVQETDKGGGGLNLNGICLFCPSILVGLSHFLRCGGDREIRGLDKNMGAFLGPRLGSY
jgi:hypothetical protein